MIQMRSCDGHKDQRLPQGIVLRIVNMEPGRDREHARIWRFDRAHGMEVLSAEYRTHTFPRHWHDTYVVGVVEGGAERFFYRGANHVAPKGRIVLVNPGEVHTGCAAGEDGWLYRSIYPTSGLFDEILGEGRSRSLIFPSAVVEDDELAAEMMRVHCRLSDPRAGALEQHGLLVSFLTKLVRRHSVEGARFGETRADNAAVTRAIDYMQGHLHSSLGLQELCGVAGLSRYHFIRVFEKATGMPPHAYLNQLRINHAKKLIAAKTPIGEVAIESGFFDQSHLTYHFKRIVGVTPGRYC